MNATSTAFRRGDLGRGSRLGAEVIVGLDQEAACADGRVQHRLAQARVDLLDHEPDHWPRCVELARVSGCVPHLTQHRLVQVGHGVDVVGRREVHFVDLVDQVTEQVTGQHPVVGLLEDRRERGASVARLAGQGDPASEWHTEENTQRLLVEWLAGEGWTIVRTANTATREHGLDVVAERDGQRLGVEVKGYPSRFYVTGPNRGQVKTSTPKEQAKKW